MMAGLEVWVLVQLQIQAQEGVEGLALLERTVRDERRDLVAMVYLHL
tara:strand:- start:228 stop:368 length:141 start_codon:yes stop_codon:yes gene_type:complete